MSVRSIVAGSLPARRAVRRAGRQVSSPQARRAAAALRRRRGIAALSVASVLASGLTTAVTTRTAPANTSAGQPGPGQPAPQPRLAPQPAVWAVNAEVTLASLRRQLDTVKKTLARLPRAQPGPAATALTALVQHQGSLKDQSSTLESHLRDYRKAEQLSAEVAAADGRLAAIDAALRDMPATRPPEQAATATELQAQRTKLATTRDANRQVLGGLNDRIGRAVATPLPAAAEATTASLIDRAITAIGEQPSRPADRRLAGQSPAAAPRTIPAQRQPAGQPPRWILLSPAPAGATGPDSGDQSPRGEPDYIYLRDAPQPGAGH